LISSLLKKSRTGVLACSALKEQYREVLLSGNQGVQLVYLKGEYDSIWRRMITRPGHYMKPEMLQSQFEALDEPMNGLVMDAILPMDEIVNRIIEDLNMSKTG
jgi:gluconokinase